jgi:hypothetical protein
MRLLAVDDFMPIAEQKFPEKTEKPQENSLRKTAQYCILAFSFYFHLKMSCWPGMSIIKKQRQSGRYHWRAVMLAMAAMTSKHQHCLELANTPHAPVKRDGALTQASRTVTLEQDVFQYHFLAGTSLCLSHTACNQRKS